LLKAFVSGCRFHYNALSGFVKLKQNNMSGDVIFKGTQEEWNAFVAKNNLENASKQEAFLERLINEEKELGEKIVSLNKELYSDGFAEKVGDYQFELLNLQHGVMLTYRRVLIIRIKDLTSK
jgi:hypothetical protein